MDACGLSGSVLVSLKTTAPSNATVLERPQDAWGGRVGMARWPGGLISPVPLSFILSLIPPPLSLSFLFFSDFS